MPFEARPAGAGGWIALAAGPRLLVAPALEDAAAALSALGEPDGFQRMLELLTRGGLGATPPFALFEGGEPARCILRGEAVVAIEDAAGRRTLDAEGVSTWVERTAPGLVGLSVVVPGAVPSSTPPLPLIHGAALVAEVSLTGSGTNAPPARPAVAAAVRPPSPSPAPDPEATVMAVDLDDPEGTATPDGGARPDGGAYDYLFGETVYHSVADAAVREEETPDEAPVVRGDHDGQTVLTSDLARLRAERDRATEPAATGLWLVLADGRREPLADPVVIGRSPSGGKLSGGRIPRLVTVGSADQDISRNHAQFAVEGGTVVVTDLHSRNGTSIVLPGKDPQRLRPGEPTSVIPGTVVDLGGGVALTIVED